jgi:hypothetical protein
LDSWQLADPLLRYQRYVGNSNSRQILRFAQDDESCVFKAARHANNLLIAFISVAAPLLFFQAAIRHSDPPKAERNLLAQCNTSFRSAKGGEESACDLVTFKSYKL